MSRSNVGTFNCTAASFTASVSSRIALPAVVSHHCDAILARLEILDLDRGILDRRGRRLVDHHAPPRRLRIEEPQIRPVAALQTDEPRRSRHTPCAVRLCSRHTPCAACFGTRSVPATYTRPARLQTGRGPRDVGQKRAQRPVVRIGVVLIEPLPPPEHAGARRARQGRGPHRVVELDRLLAAPHLVGGLELLVGQAELAQMRRLVRGVLQQEPRAVQQGGDLVFVLLHLARAIVVMQVGEVDLRVPHVLGRRVPRARRAEVPVRVDLLQVLAHLGVEAVGRQARVEFVPVLPGGDVRRIAPAGDRVAERPLGVGNRPVVLGALVVLQQIHVEVAGQQAQLQIDAVLLGCREQFVEHEAIDRIVVAQDRAVRIGFPQEFRAAGRFRQREAIQQCRARAGSAARSSRPASGRSPRW